MIILPKDIWLLILTALITAVCAVCVPPLQAAEPTTIHAEDYIAGGEGTAYHDSDAVNRGNTALRPDEGVDLWVDATGAVKVGSVKTGEWIIYPVALPVEGNYLFQFHLSTPQAAATVDLFIDDQKIGMLTAPVTGGYQTPAVVDLLATVPAAGQHNLKIVFTGPSVDLYAIDYAPNPGLASTGFSLRDRATYIGTTDRPIKVSWDLQPEADYFEAVLLSVDRAVETPAGIGKTPSNLITFRLPHAGLFRVKVRACLAAVAPEPPICSEWTLSTDDKMAMVDGVNRGWWLYGYISPPGAIDIFQNE